ncbi:MarR family transcriptional regulator, partial [Rhizobium leguminosarum]
RNLSNERQVLISLTDEGRALQHKAGCLGALNHDVRHLRNAIYSQIGGWDAPA